MENDLELISLARAATILQRTPQQISQLAARANVRPAVRLDDLPYYSQSDFARLKSSINTAGNPAEQDQR